MINNYQIIIFLTLILFFDFGIKNLSKYYNLDNPNERKIHKTPISTIGGLFFVAFFIIICSFIDLIPFWFLIGSFVSVLLGAIDDNYNVKWQIKLFVQICLGLYIASIFWGDFNQINFYHYTFTLSNSVLLLIFLFWFIGIMNAVNLIDGVDGLASGFIIIVSLCYAILGQGNTFSEINIILLTVLLVFLLFNQRPAQVFMGDAGSQFLGYYLAVSPLLFVIYNEYSIPGLISMTPHIIMASYLIADTTRVFFTRLIEGKSPMTPDTIHFHHLVIQKSGSYLATIFVIYFIASISGIFVTLNYKILFDQTGILLHLGVLLFFVLMPPTPTYVKLISLVVHPFYSWNKTERPIQKLLIARTSFIGFLVLGLISSIINDTNIEFGSPLVGILTILMLLIVIYAKRNKKIIIYIFNIFVSLLIINNIQLINITFLSKLFMVMLTISLSIFCIQKVTGTHIKNYSALDLLLCVIVFVAISLSIKPWIFASIFSLWFGFSFIFRRTLLFKSYI